MQRPTITVSTLNGYDGWAATYDAEANPMIAMAESAIGETMPNSLAGLHVVELGCGTGRILQPLVGLGAGELTGFELSPKMLAVARRRSGLGAVRWAVHDIRDPLPMEDGKADLVMISLVLEHIEQIGPGLAEASRVLVPGGRGLHPRDPCRIGASGCHREF